MEIEELDSSELGTKTYWEEAYKREIVNFDEHGDQGDVWFGEDSAYRVIQWISKSNLPLDTEIIDLGCGNGYTLKELAREGFHNLLGVDYCEEAITLAKKVSLKEFPTIQFKRAYAFGSIIGLADVANVVVGIRKIFLPSERARGQHHGPTVELEFLYIIFDITNGDISTLERKFGLVHDKGTYDAISLNPENAKLNRTRYIENVYNMLCEKGIFVITSCNWTEEELIKQFSEKLRLKQVIPTPQFKFGGKTGSVVTSVVFEK